MKRVLFVLFILFVSFTPGTARAVELTVWTSEIDAERLAGVQFLVSAFEVMQDDVKVKVVSVNENDLMDKVFQAKESGTLPHIVSTSSQLLAALDEEGYLGRGVADRLAQRIGTDRFYTGTLRLLRDPSDKRLFGVPFHGWVQGIWYRGDWFDEAGLPRPCSWKNILNAAKHFHDPANGQYGILLGTKEDVYSTQCFTQIALSNNAKMFDADGGVAFDSPNMLESLKFYSQLAKYAPPGANNWRARDYFMQGKLAMMFYSTFIMDDLALERVAANSLTGDNFPDLKGAKFDPDLALNVRMVPLLCQRKKASYGSINGFGFMKGLSPEQLTAVETLMDFLYQQEHYITWLHIAPGGMLPVIKDVGSSNHFLSDPAGIFNRYGRDKIREINDGLSVMRSFGSVSGEREPLAAVVYAHGIISKMIHRTLYEKVGAEKAVSQAAAEIQEIVNERR